MIDLSKLMTEARNPHSMYIDTMSTEEILSVISREDKTVADAVAHELSHIAQAVDVIYERLSRGGRLIYCGCGTSGRLGVLDAVECPPTYNTDPHLVQGLMAGGEKAFVRAVEGAEDSEEAGKEDVLSIGFSEKDVLVGIAASGRTPYVLGAMDYAHHVGAPVIAVTCCPCSEMGAAADIRIEVATGAEVVTGSTRMKAGTAQKMVLNMLSTAVMIKLGKVYGNLMVDVKTTNKKLRERAISIVSTATAADRAVAAAVLEECDQSAKVAIIMIVCKVDARKARSMLNTAHGHIRNALQDYTADCMNETLTM